MKDTEVHLLTARGVLMSIHDRGAGGSYDSVWVVFVYPVSLGMIAFYFLSIITHRSFFPFLVLTYIIV